MRSFLPSSQCYCDYYFAVVMLAGDISDVFSDVRGDCPVEVEFFSRLALFLTPKERQRSTDGTYETKNQIDDVS